MNVKALRKQNMALQDVKPIMKKRTAKFGAHNQNYAKQKSLVANFREDDTPSDFPDTRSYAENEESFIF